MATPPTFLYLLDQHIPTRFVTLLKADGSLSHPILLLHHFVQPNREKEHPEPTVEDKDGKKEFLLNASEGPVATSGIGTSPPQVVDDPAEGKGRVE